MSLDASGNITLNKAGFFSFAFDMVDESGAKIDLSAADIKLHIDKLGIQIVPSRDLSNPSVLHFTFTTAHAAAIGTKELPWIIRQVVAGVPEVIVEGGTITAEGFAV